MTSSGWRLLGVLLLFGVGGLFGAAWFAADECAHTEGCGAYRAHYQKPANDSSKEVPHRETAEELVASYTGWLAVFTCGLFIVTSGLWGATWRLWKTTAKAVEDGEKSVKAAVAPRAYIFTGCLHGCFRKAASHPARVLSQRS
jgi:hypothetical protein